VRQAVTNGEGLFEFPNLLPGGYAVQVSAPGFAVETRDVLLEVGQNLALDLALVLGERHETLEIVEAAICYERRTSAWAKSWSPSRSRIVPLNGRMLLDLALTVPDAHVGHGAQTAT